MPIIALPDTTTATTQNTAANLWASALGIPTDRPLALGTPTDAGRYTQYLGTLDKGFQVCVWSGKEADGNTNVWTPQGRYLSLDELKSFGGVFVRPNDVGHTDATFRGSNIAFYEIDDPNIDQRGVIAKLKLFGLIPTAVVFSGSKSLHTYFRFNRTLTANEWQHLNRALCMAVRGDTAINTLSRFMRLPGALRMKDGTWREQALEECNPQAIYSPEEFLNRLKHFCPSLPLDFTPAFWSEYTRRVNKAAVDGGDYSKVDSLLQGGMVGFQAILEAEEQARLRRIEARAHAGYTEETQDEKYRKITEALNSIPQRSPGGGTYALFRNLAWAIASELGDSVALDLLEQHSPSSSCGWNISQVLRSRNGRTGGGIGGVIKAAKLYGSGYTPNRKSPYHHIVNHPPAKATSPLGFITDFITEVAPKSVFLKQLQQNKRAVPKPDKVFSPEQRGNIYADAALRVRVILDTSGTGSGKSYGAGELTPEMFGVRQLIYFSDQHRNPTTATLKDWHDLEARHKGLTREDQADGTPRLRRISDDQQLVDVSPNCSRTELLDSLRAKNIPADLASIACSGCALRPQCASSRGDGYGYLHERGHAFKQPRLRAHFDSMPVDYALDNVAVIWDEFGSTYRSNKEIRVSGEDFAELQAYLVTMDSSFATTLRDIVARIHHTVLNLELGRFGAGHSDILESLGTFNIDALEVDRLLQPDLTFLDPTEVAGVSIADLPASVRRRMSVGGAEKIKALPKQWLGDFLRVVQGEMAGATLRVDHGGLIISLPDPRHSLMLRSVQTIIIQDATITKAEVLALLPWLKPEEIIEVRAKAPKIENVRVVQVADMGRCGKQRGADQDKRIDALLKTWKKSHRDLGAIDYKGSTADGFWWCDTRGVNVWQSRKALALVGTPCPNIASLQARYSAIVGRPVELEEEGLTEFIDGYIQAEFTQAIGRVRANRRPDEEITIYVVSDFDITPLQERLGFVLETVKGSDVTPDAGSKTERAWTRIQLAASGLIEASKKCTLAAVAKKLASISQSRISQLAREYSVGWKGFVQGLKLLLLGETPETVEDKDQTAGFLAMVTAVQDDAVELAQVLVEFTEALGFGAVAHAVQQIPDDQRAYMVARLLQGL